MPDDPSGDPPDGALPTGPAPTPSSPNHARAFADLFEDEIFRIVRAGGTLAPRAWILARRHPVSKVPYAENRYGLLVYDVGQLGSEDQCANAFARIRASAERSAALGIALAFEIRYQSTRGEFQDTPQDAVYLIVEHRALPDPRRRIIFAPPQNERRDEFSSIDLTEAAEGVLPVFVNSLMSVPALLPDLD